jgi:hypothetical protein
VPTAKSGIAAKRGWSSSAIASISAQDANGMISGAFGFGFWMWQVGLFSSHSHRSAWACTCLTARKTYTTPPAFA